MSRQPIFNAVPAILFTAMTLFIVLMSSGLGWLERHLEFSSFMIFAVVTFAVMVLCGFAWDRHEARSARRP